MPSLQSKESQQPLQTMHQITPCLWFESQAEEAATFYTSLLPSSRITEIVRNGDAVMSVELELEGRTFLALNGGPEFSFTEAVSFQLFCDTQNEVDRLWAALTDGGEGGKCGWLKDRYGLSWQVIPSVLGELLADPDPARANRAMQAMLAMGKLDAEAMRRAADGP